MTQLDPREPLAHSAGPSDPVGGSQGPAEPPYNWRVGAIIAAFLVLLFAVLFGLRALHIWPPNPQDSEVIVAVRATQAVLQTQEAASPRATSTVAIVQARATAPLPNAAAKATENAQIVQTPQAIATTVAQPTPSTAEPTPVADPTPVQAAVPDELANAILDAYANYWRVRQTAMRSPFDETIDLESVMTGSELLAARRTIEQFRRAGQAFDVTIQHRVWITSATDNDAVLVDRYTGQTVVLDAATGNPTGSSPLTQSFSDEFRLQNINGTWKVVEEASGRWLMNLTWRVAAFALALVGLPIAAHADECGYGLGLGQWRCNGEGTARSASVSRTSDGIGVAISGSASRPAPDAPQNSSLLNPAGTSSPAGGSVSAGRVVETVVRPSTGGANVVAFGGPWSFETQGGVSSSSFGGRSVGGWTFDTPIANNVTTAFSPIQPVPQINPWALAFQAQQEFPLPALTLKVNPDPGIVNVDSWFWVEGYDGNVITHSKTQHASHTECRLLNGATDCRRVDDSVTVVVRLRPKQYTWQFGDDRNNSATFSDRTGLGRAFTEPAPEQASSVAHAYHWSSINFLREGGYPISLTVTWSADFSVNGSGSSSIPDVRQTYTGRHVVRQIQSIVVR